MRDGIKIFRDPIYDLIFFDKKEDRLILDIIDTPEFQRLRRIKQLGLSSYTYTSSTHDRFSHSIGVCFLAGMLVDNLNFTDDDVKINEDEGEISLTKSQTKLLIRLAAILHDIGHGPFSHAFERAIKDSAKNHIKPGVQIHEDYSIKIISSKKHSIYGIINSHDDPVIKKYGIKWIEDILSHTFTGPSWIQEIISSQFDADRIDYLLRDAYMCGVSYARFDWDWIFRNMFIGEVPVEGGGVRQGILIDGNRGIHSLESFIVSRYHMYEQVYFHKATRGFEAVVNSIFKRLSFLIQSEQISESDFLGNYFLDFLSDYTSIDNYLQLDDYYMVSHFNHWAKTSKDDILKRLCISFVQRRPFKMIKFFTNKPDNLHEHLKEYSEISTHYKNSMAEGYEYFFLEDDYKDNPYKDNYLLSKDDKSERIWLSLKGKPKDLSEESSIIKALRNNILEVKRIFIHRDFLTSN